VDYLLKPFSFERFVQAVNKALEWHALRKNNQATRGETDASPAASRLYITVKADHKMVRLLLDDILFIEGLREYVTFHTTSGKLITLEALKNLETLLPSGRFLRVHKSYIVHKEKVKSLYGNQLEIAGQLIPIGKSYKEDVLQHLFR
jgi:DNA-binding LytR/AlgR family response regulator